MDKQWGAGYQTDATAFSHIHRPSINNNEGDSIVKSNKYRSQATVSASLTTNYLESIQGGASPEKIRKVEKAPTSVNAFPSFCRVAGEDQALGNRTLQFRISKGGGLQSMTLEDIQAVVDPSLVRNSLVRQIADIIENLFFLKGVKVSFNLKTQALTIYLGRSKGKGGERCQLPLVLGVNSVKNRKPFTRDHTNNPSYGPARITCSFSTHRSTYQTANGSEESFDLPIWQTDDALKQASRPDALVAINGLKRFRLLLLQRILAEIIYNEQMLNRLDLANDHASKQSLMQELATFDRLTTDDPDRLGFRPLLTESPGGIKLTLGDFKADMIRQIWGDCRNDQLLETVYACLNRAFPAGKCHFNRDGVCPVTPGQLASELEQKAINFTGIAFVNTEGQILRAPFILACKGPWASPGGDSKTRFTPLLGAIVEANAESGVMPTRLNDWLPLQLPDQQKTANNSVYIVQPDGFDMGDGPKDPGYPIQEFDNNQWRWFDFQEIREGALGNRPLRRECTDLFLYLAYEQRRIETALGTWFPGVLVAVEGADKDGVATHGVTVCEGGYMPTGEFGLIRLTPRDKPQSEALVQWLKEQNLNHTSNEQGLITVTSNPYALYCKSLTETMDWQSLSGESSATGNTVAAVDPWLSLRQTLETLTCPESKLVAARTYREWKKAQGVEQSRLPDDLANLLPVQTNTSGAGLYCDELTGGWFHLKSVHDEEAARSEVLMASLAKDAGAMVPITGYRVGQPGKSTSSSGDNFWIISAWVDQLAVGEAALNACNQEQLASLFVIAAWLANHNIIGRDFNHSAVDDQGRLYGLNWCGAGYFTGGRWRKSPSEKGWGGFFGTVFALRDLRDENRHYAAARVFSRLQEQDIAKAMETLLAQAPKQVSARVAAYGPCGAGERGYLEATLFERLNFLSLLYPSNLPRVTEHELGAIQASGRHGTELSVTSPHVVDQRVIVACWLNPAGEKETRVSFQLSPEKTGEFAGKLGLGKNHGDLRQRLQYFLVKCTGKKMTPALREDIRETRVISEKFRDEFRSGKRPLKAVDVGSEGGAVAKADWLRKLHSCINRLQQLDKLADDEQLSSTDKYWDEIPDLPVFLPDRVRSDWTCSLPFRAANQGPAIGPNPVDEEITLAGDAFLYRVSLTPHQSVADFPSVDEPITMEFHGPDANAYSFEGMVRLTTAGDGESAINRIMTWMEGCGLDTNRPKADHWPVYYREQLKKRGGESVTEGYLSAESKADWPQYFQRENGRTVFTLPERLRPQLVSPLFRHQLGYFGGNNKEKLQNIIAGGLSLNSFTERVRQGCRADGISNSDNIANNGANLVYCHLLGEGVNRQNRFGNYTLELKSLIHNRADHFISDYAGGQSQPWFIRHERLSRKQIKPNSQYELDVNHSLSLPESLNCIHVDEVGTRQAVIQTLRDCGFNYWPDGRPVGDIVRVNLSLKEQYDQLLKEWSPLSREQRALVQAIGLKQFKKLLIQNPHLQTEGQLTDLSGITVGEPGGVGTCTCLSGLDFTRLTLADTRLLNLSLKDCHFNEPSLQNMFLDNVNYQFTDPGHFEPSIKSIILYLESSTGSNKNLMNFPVIFQLCCLSQWREKLVQILRDKCQVVPGGEIIRWVNHLIDDGKTRPEDLLAILEQCFPDSTEIKVIALKLRCYGHSNDGHLQQALVKIEPTTLAKLLGEFSSDESRGHIFTQLKQRIEQSGEYSLLAGVELQANDFQIIKQWLQDSKSVELIPYLLKAGKSAKGNGFVLYHLLYQYWLKTPSSKVFDDITLDDLFSNQFSVSMSNVYQARKNNPQAVVDFIKLFNKSSKSTLEIENLCGEMGELFPDQPEAYLGLAKMVRQQQQRACRHAHEICMQGLEYFGNHDKKVSFEKMLVGIVDNTLTNQVADLLPLIRDVLGKDGLVKHFDSLLTLQDQDNNYTTVGQFYAFCENAICCCPERPEVYARCVEMINQYDCYSANWNKKKKPRMSREDYSHSLCLKGLKQFKTSKNKADFDVLLNEIFEHKLTAQPADLLPLIRDVLGEDGLLEHFESLLTLQQQEINSRAFDAWDRFYAFCENAIRCCPERPEVYARCVEIINQYRYSRGNRYSKQWFSRENYSHSLCLKGLEQFKTSKNQAGFDVLLNEILTHKLTAQPADLLPLIRDVLGEDKLFKHFESLLTLQQQKINYCSSGMYERFYAFCENAIHCCPERPEVYARCVEMINQYGFPNDRLYTKNKQRISSFPWDYWYTKNKQRISRENYSHSLCLKGLEQFKTSQNQTGFNALLNGILTHKLTAQPADLLPLIRDVLGEDGLVEHFEPLLTLQQQNYLNHSPEGVERFYAFCENAICCCPERPEVYGRCVEMINQYRYSGGNWRDRGKKVRVSKDEYVQSIIARQRGEYKVNSGNPSKHHTSPFSSSSCRLM